MQCVTTIRLLSSVAYVVIARRLRNCAPIQRATTARRNPEAVPAGLVLPTLANEIARSRSRSTHRSVGEAPATWPAPGDAAPRRYAVWYALIHRAEAGTWADALRLAADMSFLKGKVSRARPARERGQRDEVGSAPAQN
jgi:hypothetical protein